MRRTRWQVARWGRWLILAALALAVPGQAPAAPVGGDLADLLAVEPAWVMPRGLPGEPPRPPIPGLLTLPPGWAPGDAATVLLAEEDRGAALPHRLREALLAQHAAVLELDEAAARGVSPDSAAVASPPEDGERLAAAFGALHLLRVEAGAGLVVVVGAGAAEGRAALLAAADRQDAALRLPDGMAGFAAGIALHRDAAAAFAAGAPPVPAEGWAQRAPPLCAAIAGILAEPRAAPVLAAACVATLLAPAGPGPADTPWGSALARR